MLCEKCGKREANVYMKNVINGETTERHLCSECANEEGILKTAVNPFYGTSSFFDDFNQAFQGFFPGLTAPAAGTRGSLAAGTTCPVCGASAQDIARTGRAGCADCYSVFDYVLDPAIKRIHGDVSHTGSIPGSAGAELSKKRRLSELKHELKAAIKKEAFEDAARLRDEIRSLENGGASNE